MRAKCLDCCCGSAHEVKLCPITDCSLWPFRIGRGICTDPTGKAVQMPERSEARKKADREAGKRLSSAAQN